MRFTTATLTTCFGVLALVVTSCGESTETAPEAADANDESTPPTTSFEQRTGDSTGIDSAGGASVGILDSRYDPSEVTIAVGATATFTNKDPYAHTVTSKDGAVMMFRSELGQDASFDVRFDEAGSFAYFCEIHPTMRATIVVG